MMAKRHFNTDFRGTQVPTALALEMLDSFPIAGKPLLLQVNGLITAVLVELCSPHFVHALVLGSTEGHWCSESNVQVLEIFESLNELFGIEIRPIALQRGDQDVCVRAWRCAGGR